MMCIGSPFSCVTPEIRSMFSRILEMLNAASAAVIALMAVVSVFVARRLWKASRDAADAAKVSAEAAKENAVLARTSFEALHRPWVSVSEVRHLPLTYGATRIEVDLRNHGTMPAANVTASIAARVDSNQVCSKPDYQIGEIAPQAEVACSIEGRVMDALRQAGRGARLIVEVEIKYKGLNLAQMRHREHWALVGQTFELRGSETEEPKA
jgi:hypothetical protein